jgi:hypothetical protein
MACLASPAMFAQSPRSAAATSFYEIIAVRISPGGEVELRLKPTPGFSLNGPGYPPLTISLAPPATFAAGGARLSSVGIAEGDTAVWGVTVGPGAARLSGELRSIVCGASLCRLVEERFEIEIR